MTETHPFPVVAHNPGPHTRQEVPLFGPRHRWLSRITLNETTKRYGDRTVLDRGTLTIAPGQR